MQHLARFLLCVAIFSAGAAAAQWPSDPGQNLAIADRASEQVIPLVASRSDGGRYVAWFDLASGSYDVYLQRLDAAGTEQWPHNGILVSDHPQDTALYGWDLLCDFEDNAVLVFSDTRNGGDLDIYAYRVAADGEMLWGADGIALTDNLDFEPSPAVTQASDGDLVFVWPRFPDVGDGGIMMQRISPEGLLRLPAGGLPVVTQAGENPAFPDPVPSLDGSVIVSWVRDTSTFSSPRHLRAQRFSSSGAPVWAAVVNIFDAGSVPLGYSPEIQSDGAGGALAWWHRSSGNMYNSLVQHLSATGTELFAHNGVVVSTVTTRHHIDPALSHRQSTGEIFVFWNERNSAQSQWGIYGQKFSALGVRQWGESGLAFAPVNTVYKSYPRSVPLADGAVAFYADEPNGQFNQDRLLALRVDGAGQTVWPGSPIVVSSVLSSKARIPASIDGHGMSVVVWEDSRNGDSDVYGQNVNADGTLGPSSAGVPDGSVSVRDRLVSVPNPFRSRIDLYLQAPRPAQRAELVITDARGGVMRRLELGALRSGPQRMTWDGKGAEGRELPAGAYFFHLRDGRFELGTGRAVLIR